MQPERSADAVTRQDRHDDDARDAEEQARSGGEDRREAERRAEQSTAISSTVLAPKAMPGKKRCDGVQAVRIALPSRIASTKASSQARPNRCVSTASKPIAAAVTATQRPSPGRMALVPAKARVEREWEKSLGADMDGSDVMPEDPRSRSFTPTE